MVTVENMKPAAKMSFNETVRAGEVFVLNSQSSDLDGEIVKFEWEIEGVKIYGESIIYSFSKAGNYTIILRVFDNLGDSYEIEKKVVVLEKEGESGKKVVKVEGETDLTLVYILGGILFILFGLMSAVMLKSRKKEKVTRKEKEEPVPERIQEIPKKSVKKANEADLWGKEERVLEKEKEVKKIEYLEDLGEFEEDIEEPEKIEEKEEKVENEEKEDEGDWWKRWEGEFDLK